MTDLLTYSLTVFTGFFAVMNPIANTPIFLGLVEGESEAAKRKIAKTASLTAFLIVTSFVILGKYIFQLFGITIPAFKITGGILIFYIGFEMLMSKKSKVHDPESKEEDSGIAISPLAIPILAGPGTIVTAMNFVTVFRHDVPVYRRKRKPRSGRRHDDNQRNARRSDAVCRGGIRHFSAR